MTFKGILYQGETKTYGLVTFVNRHFVFTATDGSGKNVKWDEYSITASVEDDLVGVHSSTDQNFSVYVKGVSFAKILKEQLGVDAQFGAVHWWSRRPLQAGALISLIIVVFVLGWSALIRSRAPVLAQYISADEERSLGERTLEKILKEKPEVSLPQNLQRHWGLLQRRLLSVSELAERNWKILILNEAKHANAFALPGGIILFNSALIAEAESPEEVLGILAHEAAHVQLRHGVQAYVAGMSSAVTRLLFGSGVLPTMIVTADELYSLKYSRMQEADADRLGLEYLRSANVGADGFQKFFARAREKKPEHEAFNWLSTHPMDSAREAAIQRHLAAFKSPPVQYNLRPLQNFLKRIKD